MHPKEVDKLLMLRTGIVFIKEAKYISGTTTEEGENFC